MAIAYLRAKLRRQRGFAAALISVQGARPILSQPTIGVILAGGRSSRMGAEKALLALGGQPLIAHVAGRLRPQVDALFINANGDPDRFAWLDCPVVADGADVGAAGPLIGLRAAFAFAASRGFARLATAPCDAPFLPLELVARLDAAMTASGAPAAAAQGVSGLEPMFALWSLTAEREIAAELANGGASPRGVLERLGADRVTFAADDDLFANLNRPEDLAAAEARLNDPA